MLPKTARPALLFVAALLRTATCIGSDSTPAWEKIAALFEPPAQFQNQFGSYRSPLVFEDGTRVSSPAEWSRRRQEISRYWYFKMGPWPRIIEKPRLEYLEKAETDLFTRHKVRLEIAPDQTGLGYLLVPRGTAPFPAVLVPFYEPETSVGLNNQRNCDFGLQLARRGFVTLSIGSPGGDARRSERGEATCQPLSFLAYIAANCWCALANLKEVDPKRIGIVGHSYGGKWAMFGSALYDKFACAAWSDPGIVFDESRPNVNYWERWYLGAEPGRQRAPGIPSSQNPRTGAYRVLVQEHRDLTDLHALMAPRPFLVSGGSEDPPERWTALNHTVAVNKLLGVDHRVALSSRPDHNPTAESNEQICAFFEHFLGSGGQER